MELEVTRNFEKQFGKLTSQQQQAVMDAFEKLSDNPQSVRFEAKTGNARDIHTMRAAGGMRVAFTQNANGDFVPAFVGKHDAYDKFLAQKANKLTPDALLGSDNSRVRTMDLDIPEGLRKPGVVDTKTNFSIGGIKLRGLAGGVITGGAILALGGTPRDAVAATTPGHVGLELAEGDIQGATEALVVDGAGDVGCVAGGIAGAKGGAAGGAAVGVWAFGAGAGPGALGGGIIGGIGGCVVGGIAASSVAQAAWNWAFGDDTVEMQDPNAVLDDLKVRSIDEIPDEISPDMSEDMKQLVSYKQNVSEAVDELNETAEALAADPENEAAREAFVAANGKFTEAAEAYQYSWDSIEDKEPIQTYLAENDPNAVVEAPPTEEAALGVPPQDVAAAGPVGLQR